MRLCPPTFWSALCTPIALFAIDCFDLTFSWLGQRKRPKTIVPALAAVASFPFVLGNFGVVEMKLTITIEL